MLNQNNHAYTLSWASFFVCLMVCLVPAGRANAALTSSTVFSFDLTTGSGGVVESNGFLFGAVIDSTSTYGGAIYKVNINGGQPQTIFQFSGEKSKSGELPSDGYLPKAGLIVSQEGMNTYLYGTTQLGPKGKLGGTIFRLKDDGTEFKTLYTFSPDGNGLFLDGKSPEYPLTQDLNSNYLYGVTPYGGLNGTGVVFRICRDGIGIVCGDKGFEVMHYFDKLDESGNNDGGAYPSGPLLLTEQDGVKWLYGVTSGGGRNSIVKRDLSTLSNIFSAGSGTIYRIRVDKLNEAYDFQHLSDFDELCIPADGVGNDACRGKTLNGVGISPVQGLLRVSSGNIVGITTGGGDNGLGSIYKFDINLPSLSIIHSFDKDAGFAPIGTLVQKSIENKLKLFGIYTSNASVFSVDVETKAHQIEFLSDGAITVSPNSNLYLSSSGNDLFGTTGAGGGCGYGSVYRLSFDGSKATPYTNCTVYTSSSGGGSMDKTSLWVLLGLAALASVRRRVFSFN